MKYAIIAALAVSLPLAAALFPAYPHDATPTAAAPQGWSYPLTCCSGIDCREMALADVAEGPLGFEIAASGETIPMTDKRIRESPDGLFHRCSVMGKDDSRTICLFVPSRGY